MSRKFKKGLLPQKWMGKKIAQLNPGEDAMLTLNGKYLQLNIGLKKANLNSEKIRKNL